LRHKTCQEEKKEGSPKKQIEYGGNKKGNTKKKLQEYRAREEGEELRKTKRRPGL